jgi:hypothetical protein
LTSSLSQIYQEQSYFHQLLQSLEHWQHLLKMAAYIEPVVPTKRHVQSISEIPTIIDNCLEGKLNHIARPPREREFAGLVESGNVFVYEENASGVREWRDGLQWEQKWDAGDFTIETSPIAESTAWQEHSIPQGIARVKTVIRFQNYEHHAVFYFNNNSRSSWSSQDHGGMVVFAGLRRLFTHDRKILSILYMDLTHLSLKWYTCVPLEKERTVSRYSK